MALKIGFATEFYTLWDVTSETQYAQFEGQAYPTGIVTRYWFKGNISKDLEKAKAKYPGLDVDYELRGKFGSWEKFEKIDRYLDDEFGWGKVAGSKIMESTALWYLWTVYENHLNHRKENSRRAVYARRRLIQLGELVSHVWFEVKDSGDLNWGKRDEYGNCLPELHEDIQVKRKYINAKKLAIIKAQEKEATQPYLFNAGQRVELRIKETKVFSFDGMYGTTFVAIYETHAGQIVKYMGGSPVSLGHINTSDGFVTVKATIKHKEYKGMKGTYLQRIAIV